MPERFRKKPVEIEAVRWDGHNEMELIAFTEGGFTVLPPTPYPPHLEHLPPPPNTAQVYDKLHHTWVGVETGQWVIRGIKGEFYPCADDVFTETYEEAR
ncbi:hypothetical protein [Actinomadura sp. WMMA1423]|uniref:hypothetical protein n=1 Tax=Actinomadura sp. WMMA1423 TaxID=2591108 RepID=UPI001146BF10|nr:hypothetical protein [Actinomadura sp. WMMA1423]